MKCVCVCTYVGTSISVTQPFYDESIYFREEIFIFKHNLLPVNANKPEY